MIVPGRPTLARACQLARSEACESLEAIQMKLEEEGLDACEALKGADVRRMLRSLIRQSNAGAAPNQLRWLPQPDPDQSALGAGGAARSL